MTRPGLSLAATIALACAYPAAAAEHIFAFATNQLLFGGPVTGEGMLITTDAAVMIAGRSAFTVTSISGTVNGSAIVAPSGNYGIFFPDAGPFLDGVGLRFFTAAGNDIRFFFQDSAGRYRVNTFSPGSSSFVSATATRVAAVPEPSSWAMLIMGFGAVGASIRSARKQLPAAA